MLIYSLSYFHLYGTFYCPNEKYSKNKNNTLASHQYDTESHLIIKGTCVFVHYNKNSSTNTENLQNSLKSIRITLTNNELYFITARINTKVNNIKLNLT